MFEKKFNDLSYCNTMSNTTPTVTQPKSLNIPTKIKVEKSFC